MKNIKGSSTIETCILFPVIAGIVVLSVYIPAIILNRTITASCISIASATAASEWNYPAEEMFLNSEPVRSNSIYGNLYDKHTDAKLDRTKEHALSLIKKNAFISEENTHISAYVKNEFIQKIIVIETMHTYTLPFELPFLPQSKDAVIKFNEASFGGVRAPVDNIRNLDYIYGLAARLKEG